MPWIGRRTPGQSASRPLRQIARRIARPGAILTEGRGEDGGDAHGNQEPTFGQPVPAPYIRSDRWLDSIVEDWVGEPSRRDRDLTARCPAASASRNARPGPSEESQIRHHPARMREQYANFRRLIWRRIPWQFGRRWMQDGEEGPDGTDQWFRPGDTAQSNDCAMDATIRESLLAITPD